MVKQANDIVEVIGEYLKLQKRGRVYKGLCPFHNDHNPSFDVDPTRQRYRCWVCGKFGDVISFVQERERVEFREALELLARRAGLTLRRGANSADTQSRATMLDLMKWAEEQYHRNLQQSAGAQEARAYLQERHLSSPTIERYRLGYAPNSWDWLTPRALKAGWSAEMLVKVGLSAPRDGEDSCYDRFRDRVIFPIRDVRGRTVGFGGRILPGSPTAAKGPKYYNSADTPLFTKSEHLYGLDQARAAGETAGYLAVVEGYTDVLMAHQAGILPVVATLGTALNVRHITQLRRFVPKVILVFDADAGGERGVDLALELFVSQEVDLAIATLPAGLDPCDLLVQQGPEPFKTALENAVDALEFKLNRVMTPERTSSLEGQRRAVDEVLQVLALAPEVSGHLGQLKRELIVNRIAQRTRIKEETIWNRLRELQRQRRPSEAREPEAAEAPQRGPASALERDLLSVLLAEPALVPRAGEAVQPEEIEHPGLQRLLRELYDLNAAGQSPDVDRLRLRVGDNPALAETVLKLQGWGLGSGQRAVWLEDLLAVFRERRLAPQVDELHGRLREVPDHGPVPVDLLRQLQQPR